VRKGTQSHGCERARTRRDTSNGPLSPLSGINLCHEAFKYVRMLCSPLRPEWLELWAGLSGRPGHLWSRLTVRPFKRQATSHVRPPSWGVLPAFLLFQGTKKLRCSGPPLGHMSTARIMELLIVCYSTPQSMSRLRPLCRAGPLRRRGMGPLHTRRVANARGLVGRGVVFRSGSQPWDGELQVSIGTRSPKACVPFVEGFT
jgi:hypothetical protein